jgi:hypothetical protein
MEKSIEDMTKDELEQLQVIKELEYQQATGNLSVVEIEDNRIATQVAELQVQRKKLGGSLIQGKSNVRKVKSELNNIKTMIYRRLAGL